MSMTADQIVDRRRMRRKLSFWRVTGFIALILLIVAGAVVFSGRDAFPLIATPQIARISISGFITDDRAQTQLIERLAETDAVSGVIVAIDSTGGATTGGESLYVALRKLAEAKPTVATVGTFGASAAYMAAIATDHIVARRTSITGSIGVIFQYPEVSELLEKLGVAVEDIKSAPLKAEPSPFKPTSEEARRVIAGIVKDSFDWFVARRRAYLHRPAGARRETDRRDRGRGRGGRLARHAGRRRQAAGQGLETAPRHRRLLVHRRGAPVDRQAHGPVARSSADRPHRALPSGELEA
jgi:protease-4